MPGLISVTNNAREAPREFALISGAMLGAWALLKIAEGMERQLKGEKLCPAEAAPDVNPTLETLAYTAVQYQTRAAHTLARVCDLLTSHN